jgi:hypothetical protein
VHVDEETPLRTRSTSSLSRAGPRFETSVVLIALAAIGVISLLVIAAWRYGSNTPPTAVPDFSNPQPSGATKTPKLNRPRKLTRAKMTVTGALGRSWLEVYAGSAAGKKLYEGTLDAAHSVRFGTERAYRRYFVRMRRPGNLRMTVNGRVVRLPKTSSPKAVFVTADRVTQAAPRA